MLQSEMLKADIPMFLRLIESVRGIKILHAVESGSRAWGFDSPNSDFDVRFIYARPIDHYLTFNVELKRDVIETGTDLHPEWDVVGWDIRKALGLFTRSNGALLEHLRSPICYREPHESIEHLTKMAETEFNPTALCFHYYRMAKNNARQFLEKETVSLKKYLYVLRGFIAADFVREQLELPPVVFNDLLEATAAFNEDVAQVRTVVHQLIEVKKRTAELGEGNRIPDLDVYIEKALSFNEQEFVNLKKDDFRRRTWDDRLNDIFQLAVGYEKEISDV